MHIGKVAEQYSVSIETLRYYDKIGLLKPRRVNNQRVYSNDDVIKLQKILKMKKLLFTLGEINSILALDEQLDLQISTGYIDKNAVSAIENTLVEKYAEILNLESDLRKVKADLEKLMQKIEEFGGM